MKRRDFLMSSAAGAATFSLTNVSLQASQGPVGGDIAIQKLVDETARELGIDGAQLAIHDGVKLREFATGLANLERQVPVRSDTLFQIGSTTKVYNAATIMTLVDEGALDLDTPVKNYIRDFKLADARSTDSVTLRHLLSMWAGIDNGPYTDYGRGQDAIEQYVKAFGDVPVVFEPGEGFGYSNAGTNISGLAAQQTADKPCSVWA